MVNVTKTYLPPFQEYEAYLKGIWERGWITNNGQLVQELEKSLKDFLGVKHLFFCSNGTVVLQMAIKALGIKKEVITTPYSYVATTNAILWEGCTPVFVDVNDHDFCIDSSKIERAINENTEAILATHVYGNPCQIDVISELALKYNLKVIYDGAHAFGCTFHGTSVMTFGDISTCSFHATKIFHTVEGGMLATADDELAKNLYLYRQFGHVYDNYYTIGINAKNSEMHAAMGLCMLPRFEEIKKGRQIVSELYDTLLSGVNLKRPIKKEATGYNFAYYPIIFHSEKILLRVIEALKKENIFGRRYFYPSLNKLPYYEGNACPVSESISVRVLSLPLYPDLDSETVNKICDIIKTNV